MTDVEKQAVYAEARAKFTADFRAAYEKFLDSVEPPNPNQLALKLEDGPCLNAAPAEPRNGVIK